MAGGVNVGELVAKLRADTSEWKGGFSEAERTARTFSDRFGSILKTGVGTAIGFITAKIAMSSAQWARDLSRLGLEAKVQEAAFASVARAAGASADKILASMQRAAGGVLNVSDVMQAASRGLLQGFDQTQLTRLMEIARAQSKIAGRDVSEAFNAITESIANLQVRGLKTMGIVIDLDQALKDFAGAAGRTAEELTETGRMQAVYEAVVRRTSESVKTLTTVHRTESEEVQRLRAGWKQLGEDLGKVIPHGALAAAGLSVVEGLTKTVGEGLTILATLREEVAKPYVAVVQLAWDFGAGAFMSIIQAIEGAMDAAERKLKESAFGRWVWEKVIASKLPAAGAAGPRADLGGDAAREAARAASMSARGAGEASAIRPDLFLHAPALRAEFDPDEIAQGAMEMATAMTRVERDQASLMEVSTRATITLNAETRAIEDLTRSLEESMVGWEGFEAGMSASSEELLRAGTRMNAADRAMGDLDVQMREISAKARLFGKDFDVAGARISATKGAMEALIREGLDPADARLVRLSEALQDLERFQSLKEMFRDVFGSITGAIGSAVQGVIQGTQTMRQAFANLGNYIVLEFAKRVLAQALNPIINALASVAAGLLVPSVAQAAAGQVAASAGGAIFGGGGGALSNAAAMGGAQAAGGGTFSSIFGAGQTAVGLAGAFPGIANLAFNYGVGGIGGALLGTSVASQFAAGIGGAGVGLEAVGTGAAPSGLAGAGGALSAAAPFLAGIGIAFNLYSAFSDLGSPASTGTLAGTAVGAIIGGIIGNVPGALIGAALGGSAGGFLGGLFGGGESRRLKNIRAREEQDVALDANIAGAWSTLVKGLQAGDLKTFQDLSGVLRGQGIGQDQKLRALSESQVARDLLVQLDRLIGAGPFPVNFPRGGGLDSDVAAAISWHTGVSPRLGSPNDAPALLEQVREALTGAQGLQADKIEAARDAIKKLRDSIRQFTNGIGALAGVTTASTASFASYREELEAMLARFVADIERARERMATATDLAHAVQAADDLRTLIAQRYEEEIAFVRQVIGAWVDAKGVVDAAVTSLRGGELASTNPSVIFESARTSFNDLVAKFFANPDPAMVEGIIASGGALLQAGQAMYTRPSESFRTLFEATAGTLESVSGGLQNKIGEFTGGATFEDFMKEKQQVVVDQLKLLHDDLTVIVGRLDPALQEAEALALFEGLSSLNVAQLTNDQIAIAYLSQIEVNTRARGPGPPVLAETGFQQWRALNPDGTPVSMSSMVGPGVADPAVYGWQVPFFQHGTERVPETGLAMIHKDEAVLSPARAEVYRRGELGVTVQVGDIVVHGGGDPRATAEAVLAVLERRLRAPGRLRAAVQAVARER